MQRAGTTARRVFFWSQNVYRLLHWNVLGAIQQPFNTRCPVEIGQPTECIVMVLQLAGFLFRLRPYFVYHIRSV